MKILMLSTGMGLGGAETQICGVVQGLIARGHEVHVAWLTGQAGIKLPERAVTHPFGINKTPIGFIQAIFKLNRLINRIKPDVIHAHMVHANLIARLTKLTLLKQGRHNKPRLICTAHSSNEGGKLLMLGYRLTDKLTDITTHVSKEAATIFIQKQAVTPGRVLVVPNGIDTAHFAPNPIARKRIRDQLDLTDRPVIMIVGRLEWPKNHASLIEAFSRVSTQHPTAYLIVVGDGSLKGELEHMVLAKQLQNQIIFLGARTDIADLLNAADIVALSSRFEGFGLVVAEAMATQKIVVATECGAISDMLPNVGIMVPIESIAALTAGLQEAMAMPEKTRTELGVAARQVIIDHFSIDSTLNRWLSIYQP